MSSARSWWRTPDSPGRALLVGALLGVAALGCWVLAGIEDDARWLHLVIAVVLTVFAGRSIATWLVSRPGSSS